MKPARHRYLSMAVSTDAHGVMPMPAPTTSGAMPLATGRLNQAVDRVAWELLGPWAPHADLASEGGAAAVRCSRGVVAAVFASWGTPVFLLAPRFSRGWSTRAAAPRDGQLFAASAFPESVSLGVAPCDAPAARRAVEAACVGRAACAVDASPAALGVPDALCGGRELRLAVAARCGPVPDAAPPRGSPPRTPFAPKCYARRYADVRAHFCGDDRRLGGCKWAAIRKHMATRGAAERRDLTCDGAYAAVSTT